MTACATWLARDYLARHGRPVDIPPCPHDPADCPPVTARPHQPHKERT